MRQFVVTGAGGFIGQALTRKLVKSGAKVIGVYRKLPQPDAATATNFRTLEIDLREPEALNGLIDSDTTIFHLAGHTSVAGSVKDPLNDFDNNVRTTLEVLESVRIAGGRLVIPSSPAVFGPQVQLPIKEDATKNPVSPYGAAKLAGEVYAKTYHTCYGIDVRIARIFNVYGPGMTRFAIYDFWKKVRENPNHMEILGEGNQIRDYLFMDDAIEALLAIAERGEAGGDYNLASGVPVQSIELARKIATIMGAPNIEITALGRSFPGDIPRWYADVSRLKGILNNTPIELDEGLRRTIDWLNESQLVANLENMGVR